MNGRKQAGSASKTTRRTANKLLEQLEDDLARYKGLCLFVTDESGGVCNEPVPNNCHVVSESAVLEKLRDDKIKKVLELQWGVSGWRELVFRNDVAQLVQDPTTFDPEERTTSEACVGWFACKAYAHDDEFKPIDISQPNFSDPTVSFLAGYRTAMYVADQYRKAIWLLEEWNQVIRGSLNRQARRNAERGNDLLRRTMNELRRECRQAESYVALLGKSWHARNTTGTLAPDVVSAEVLRFRSKLRLAGAVSYGKASGVNVFPIQGDWHMMGVFNSKSGSDPAGRDLERLARVAETSRESDAYGVVVTKELMTNGWGSLAVSPRSYEGLNDQDRFTIQDVVAKQTRGRGFVNNVGGR